jgi:hypothetical protein
MVRNLLYRSPRLLSVVAAISLAATGCTKSGSESNGGGSDSSSNDPRSATTACGVVVNGRLTNPVDFKDGEEVSVTDVLSGNLVALTPKNGGARLVVKLQGVGSPASNENDQNAIETIRRLTSSGAYFFKATQDCDAGSLGGGRGTVGSLLSKNGESINEEVIKRGFAPADTNDACSGSLLGGCFQALDESNDDDQTSSKVGCGFLWKPVSDKDGNLAILVDECSVRVFVNGQELEQAGAGNARCTTVRGAKPGCAYGQATVEIFDQFTGLPYVFPNGKTKLSVNGCSRFEFPCT